MHFFLEDGDLLKIYYINWDIVSVGIKKELASLPMIKILWKPK